MIPTLSYLSQRCGDLCTKVPRRQIPARFGFLDAELRTADPQQPDVVVRRTKPALGPLAHRTSRVWSTENALQALAKVAATYDVRPGGLWRTMADTTEDPVIKPRSQSRPREVIVDYRAGHRFPHLKPLEGTRTRLDEILAAG